MAERIFKEDPLDIKNEIEQELLLLNRTFDYKLELLKAVKENPPDFEIIEEPSQIKVQVHQNSPALEANCKLENAEEEEETIDFKNVSDIEIKAEPGLDLLDIACCKDEDLDEDVKNAISVPMDIKPISPVRNEVREELNVKICEDEFDELKLWTLKKEIFSYGGFITENMIKSNTNVVLLQNNELENDASARLSCNKPTDLETLTDNRNKNSIVPSTNSISKKNNSNPDQSEDHDGITSNQKNSIKNIKTTTHHGKSLGVLLNFVDSEWKSGTSLNNVNSKKDSKNGRNKSSPKGNRNKGKTKCNPSSRNRRVNSSIKQSILLSCPDKKKLNSVSDNSGPCKKTLVNNKTSESCSNDYSSPITRKRRKTLRNLGNHSYEELDREFEMNCKRIKTGSRRKSVASKVRPEKNKSVINKSDVCRKQPVGDQVSSERGLEIECKIKSGNKKNSCVEEKPINSDENFVTNEKRRNVSRVKHSTNLGCKSVRDSGALSTQPDKVISMQKNNNLLGSDSEPSLLIRKNKHDSNQKYDNSTNASSFGLEPCKRTTKFLLKSGTKRKESSLTDKTSNTKPKSGSDNKSAEPISEPNPCENSNSVKTVTESKDNLKVVKKISKSDPAVEDSLVCQTVKEKTTHHKDSSSGQQKTSESQQNEEIFSSERKSSKYNLQCPVLAYLCICGAWCKSGQALSEHLSKCNKLQPSVLLSRI